jgi:hypothetical protein
VSRFSSVFCLFALAVAGKAHAQQWDVAGQLALLNRNKAELGGYDHWYSVAAIDGSAGWYWTPHLKTELNVGTAAQGEIGDAEPASAPGSPFPFRRYRDHKLRETTFGATAMYQFFENQWVHPFVGAGVELVYERHIVDALPATNVTISPTPVPLPALPAVDSVTYSLRPLITGGFKFYVAPHAFIRTEVRASLTSDLPAALQWRGGLGFDF